MGAHVLVYLYIGVYDSGYILAPGTLASGHIWCSIPLAESSISGNTDIVLIKDYI